MSETGEGLDGMVTIRTDGEEYTVRARKGLVYLPKKVAKKNLGSASKKVHRGAPQVKVFSVKAVAAYGPQAVTGRIVDALGNNATAALLGVAKDRPSRWISGQDTPNEANRAQLADLDALVGHLAAAFTPEQAQLWLEGQNPHLGARPVDVFRLRGAAPVIEAIAAHEQGAFA